MKLRLRRRLDPCSETLAVLVLGGRRALALDATVSSLLATCLDPAQLRVHLAVHPPADERDRRRLRAVGARFPAVGFEEAAAGDAVVAACSRARHVAIVAEGALFTRPWSVSAAVDRLQREPGGTGVVLGPGAIVHRAGALRPWARALGYGDADGLEAALRAAPRRLFRRAPRLLEAADAVTLRAPAAATDEDARLDEGDRVDVAALVGRASARALPLCSAGGERPASAAPAVSVVVTSFGLAEFLPVALRSLVHQTFPDWEAVVVDDGSPDDTAGVVRAFAAEHPRARIRLVRQANGGVVHARNNGARFARGRYLAALDGDDAFAPEYLERAVAALEADPALGVAVPDMRVFGAANKVWEPREPLTAAALARRNSVTIASLCRREVWETGGGFDPAFVLGFEDWELWIRSAERGVRFARLEAPLLLYRKRPGSRDHLARKRGALLRAQLTMAHPALYPAGEVEEARALLAREAPPAPKPRPEPREEPLR